MAEGNKAVREGRKNGGAARSGAMLLTGGISHADLAWLGRFSPPETMLLLRKNGQTRIAVPMLEYGRVARAFPQARVETAQSLGLKGNAARRLSCWARKLLADAAVKQVRVARNFPVGLARELERDGIRVLAAGGDLLPERAIKTREELRCIRRAQQAAVIAMRSAIAMIGEATIAGSGLLRVKGRTLTSERLRETIGRLLLDHGCFCEHTIVAGGAQGADPHERGHGPLKAGEPIVIDIFPKDLSSGYWGDLTRTVVRGVASARLRRMYQAVKAAHQAALAKVKPGVSCGSVHRAAAETLARCGFRTRVENGRPEGFIHGTGHGVGLEVHESPSLGANPERLRQGHVVTIEPGLYYPELGGIRIEDTVVVAAHGWRYFVPCEKRFEL